MVSGRIDKTHSNSLPAEIMVKRSCIRRLLEVYGHVGAYGKPPARIGKL